MEKVQLRNGLSIPSVGLGTWRITDKQEMYATINSAYEQGYRLFDTAAAYRNEMVFGKAVKELELPREELFIQDKLWNTCYGYEKAQEACKKSMRKLKIDYLDAYLIHWPASPGQYNNWCEINAETWRGMEKLYEEGYVRAIGVCNFKPHHLIELSKTAQIMPLINQIELHPGMLQSETVLFCREKGIQVEASSPLGNGQILTNEILGKIAKEKGISTAQLCLKWELKHGTIAIPKTTKASRLAENMKLFNYDLTEEEMQIIDGLAFCGGLGIDSDEVTDFEGL